MKRSPMKAAELVRHSQCDLCGGSTLRPIPIFYVVTVARLGVLVDACQRSVALAQVLGSAQLAEVMGPDEDLTRTLLEPQTLTVCEGCAYERNLVIALALEKGSQEPAAVAPAPLIGGFGPGE